MTTVLAVETDGDVFYAYDSMVTGQNEKSQLEQPKVFVNNGAVYGVAGGLIYLNEFRYAEMPAPPEDVAETDRWATMELCPAVRELISIVNPKRSEDGFETNLLVAANGRVYEVSGDTGWCRAKSGVYFIGSGGQFGAGALAAGADLYSAIRVAAKLDAYTGYDLTVASASKLLRDA